MEKHLLSALWWTIKTLVCLPFFLAWAIASLPVWALNESVAGKLKDRTFRNSFRCGIAIILWTILWLIGTVVLFCTLKWYWALAGALLLMPAPLMAYAWFEQVRRCASSWRYLSNRRIRKMKNDLTEDLKTI